ncbi:MAG: tRNA(Glu)-specific nuclease WapA precursor [Firmicutes bacterium ADurb.Bin193]|nr:MAG: tRNA(Glu)-specific nuclease WapA precursor [Firmicutes bacterium ADurb.Bin193]
MSQREQKRPCFAEAWASAISKNGKTTTASYTYNATGIRPSKTVDGVTTQHLLDGVNVAADVTNGQVTAYIRGLSLIAVRRPDGELLRYVTDGHGDVRALMEQGGNVAKRYSYDAFGNEVGAAGDDANPFRYCGEYFDRESGSIYLRARYYDPRLGRFGSEDPARDGLNWYVYCGNSPIKFKDSTGLAARIVDCNKVLFDLLQGLTDDTLYMDENGKVWIVATNSGDKTNGTELVRRILWNEDESRTITIEMNDAGKNSFNPDTLTVSLDLNAEVGLMVYNPDGSGSHRENAPDFVRMSHELIHADHFLRGTYEKGGPKTWNRAVNEMGDPEEMKTVGPIEWEEDTGRRNRSAVNGDDITENDIRWENGVVLRSGYY